MKIVAYFSDGLVAETVGSVEAGHLRTTIYDAESSRGEVLTTSETFPTDPFGGKASSVATSRASGKWKKGIHVAEAYPHRGSAFSFPASESLEALFYARHNSATREAMKSAGIPQGSFQRVEVYVSPGESCPAEYVALAEKSPKVAAITYLE